MIRRITLITLLVSLASLASAGETGRTAATQSLFSRLGGIAQLEVIAQSTVRELAAQSGGEFSGNLAAMQAELVAHLCAVTGGGCRSRASHGALRSPGAMIEALRVAMRTHAVPLAARNELIEALAPAQDVARL